MRKVTLASLRAHKRRLVSTFVAVMLGVAFLSGTLILNDTIGRTFDQIFVDVNAGTDAYVRNSLEISASFSVSRGRIPASLVDDVSAIAGVAATAPVIQGTGQIVGKNGAVGNPSNGPPTFAGNWIDNDELSPFHLLDGRAPAGNAEVVIDESSADEGGLALGDPARVITEAGSIPVTVVGIARFGTEKDSTGGATYALFSLDDAENLVIEQPGQIDGIRVAGAEGISQRELADAIQAHMPDTVEVLTGDEITQENRDEIGEVLAVFGAVFSSFAFIALIVVGFTIFNTFTILVVQRTREMALLRAVGARRSQVLWSVFVEALLVGFVASVVGVFLGIAVSQGLKALLDAGGFGFPAHGIAIEPGTLVAPVVVGLIITVLAAVVPARRASKTPPIAALRDVAIDRTTASTTRIVIGAIVTGIGLLNVIPVVVGEPDNPGLRILSGALFCLVGTIILGPLVASPVTRVLGRPLTLVRGVTGKLARENASRNPKRTAGTASALLIGAAVVSGVTLMAASFKASLAEQIDRSFGGDLTISVNGVFGFGGLSPSLASDVAALPEVASATGGRFGVVELDGKGKDVFVLDTSADTDLLDLGVTEGDIAALGADGLAVTPEVAHDHEWDIGTQLPVKFADGAAAMFTIRALYDNNDITGTSYVISTEAWNPHATFNFDTFVLIKLADGVSLDEGRAALEPLAAAFPNAKIQDREQFKDSAGQQINQFLAIVYAMLLLSIIVSLMGIANTLSLSIRERTHELGLLRAVGMDRSQVKSLVLWESVLIAIFGTAGGLGLGVLFSRAGVAALDSSGINTYSFAPGALVLLLLLGAGAGLIAAVMPARRAAKLNVLDAIATE